MGKSATDNSPAARLLNLIQEAKSQNSSEKTIAVWARVFLVDSKNTVEIFSRLVAAWKLVDETETLIHKIPDLDHDHFLRGMPSIRQGLSLSNLDLPWEVARQHFSDTAVAHLTFCAERISKFFPEDVIPDATLKDIQTDIDALFDKIKQSSLRDDFKELLLDLLERIQRGLSEYRIRGAVGLSEALEATIGRLVTKRLNANETADCEEEKALLRGVKEIVLKVGSAIDKALKIKVLIDYGAGLLDKFLPSV